MRAIRYDKLCRAVWRDKSGICFWILPTTVNIDFQPKITRVTQTALQSKHYFTFRCHPISAVAKKQSISSRHVSSNMSQCDDKFFEIISGKYCTTTCFSRWFMVRIRKSAVKYWENETATQNVRFETRSCTVVKFRPLSPVSGNIDNDKTRVVDGGARRYDYSFLSTPRNILHVVARKIVFRFRAIQP